MSKDDDNTSIGQGTAIAKQVAKGISSVTPGGIAKQVVIQAIAEAIEEHGWDAVRWAVDKLKPKPKESSSSAGLGIGVALLALAASATGSRRRRR